MNKVCDICHRETAKKYIWTSICHCCDNKGVQKICWICEERLEGLR